VLGDLPSLRASSRIATSAAGSIEQGGGHFKACAATQSIRTLNPPGDWGHIGVNHDVGRPQREVAAQVVVSGVVIGENPARGLGHPVAHHQQHRVGGAAFQAAAAGLPRQSPLHDV